MSRVVLFFMLCASVFSADDFAFRHNSGTLCPPGRTMPAALKAESDGFFSKPQDGGRKGYTRLITEESDDDSYIIASHEVASQESDTVAERGFCARGVDNFVGWLKAPRMVWVKRLTIMFMGASVIVAAGSIGMNVGDLISHAMNSTSP